MIDVSRILDELLPMSYLQQSHSCPVGTGTPRTIKRHDRGTQLLLTRLFSWWSPFLSLSCILACWEDEERRLCTKSTAHQLWPAALEISFKTTWSGQCNLSRSLRLCKDDFAYSCLIISNQSKVPKLRANVGFLTLCRRRGCLVQGLSKPHFWCSRSFRDYELLTVFFLSGLSCLGTPGSVLYILNPKNISRL